MDQYSICKITLVVFLGIVTYYDIKKLIIPDIVILGGCIVGLLLMFLVKNNTLTSMIIASTVVGGIGGIVAYITKGGLGMGDVKLLASMGIYISLWNLLNVLLISTIFSGIAGVFLLGLGKASKKTTMPFAPFILLSTIILIFGGQLGM